MDKRHLLRIAKLFILVSLVAAPTEARTLKMRKINHKSWKLPKQPKWPKTKKWGK